MPIVSVLGKNFPNFMRFVQFVHMNVCANRMPSPMGLSMTSPAVARDLPCLTSCHCQFK